MSDEVDAETQAAMKLKLVDDVRALIRSELQAAFADPAWMGKQASKPVSDMVLREFHPSNMDFRAKVKEALKGILASSY
jgi:hypothetical protein